MADRDAETLLRIARAILAPATWCFAITLGEDGDVHARLVQPGALAEDWSTRFLTDARSRKVAEMERTGRLTLAWQNDADRAYVALIGRPEIIRDAEAKRAIWHAGMARFHPGGPEDPNNVLVRFVAERIEMYSGAHGIAPPPEGFSAAVLTRTTSGWKVGATFAK